MKNDGGPAFPLSYTQQYGKDEGRQEVYGGMTLRDYFAGQALNGFLACTQQGEKIRDFSKVAQEMYLLADAMIAEREKP